MFSPVSRAKTMGIYRANPKPDIDSYHASCEKSVAEVREVGCFAWINFSWDFLTKANAVSLLSQSREDRELVECFVGMQNFCFGPFCGRTRPYEEPCFHPRQSLEDRGYTEY